MLVCEAEGETSATGGRGVRRERYNVRSEGGAGLSGLSRLSGLSGAMNKRDETDKTNQKDTHTMRGPCYLPSGISITRPPMTSSSLKSFFGLCGWVL